MTGNGQRWRQPQPGEVEHFLIERLQVSDMDTLVLRLLGALVAVLRATGDHGAEAFDNYCNRL